MFTTRAYSVLNPQLQETLISWRARIRRSFRERRTFRQYLANALNRERWTAQELSEFQKKKLHYVLQHARREVPYYADLTKSNEIDGSEQNVLAEIRRLPFLSRSDLINEDQRIISNEWRHGRIRVKSSGTTGTPVTIVQDLRAINRENAFVWRQLIWAGYKPHEPRAWIRADMIVPPEVSAPPFWRMNRCENMLMMSSYHLSESSSIHYINALKAFRPTLIQAFPSSIAFLAKYLESQNSHFNQPALKGIVTSSESISDDDRKLVKERFGCQVFDWYGACENVAAIGTCEFGSYHLLTDYSHVELEPTDDGMFELIGTGFNNRLMPLIRYRTGDLVEPDATGAECDCRRAFPIIRRIHGRQDDCIKLTDGRRIVNLDHIFEGVKGIAEAQIIQNEWDAIQIRMVPLKSFGVSSARMMRHNSKVLLGAAIRVEIETVTSLPRTSNGKFRSVICNIKCLIAVFILVTNDF